MNKVYCIGSGVVTPVGNTPEEVLAAVRAGRDAKQLYPGFPEPYYASILPRDGFQGPSFFEHISILAARKALEGIEITPRTALVLSTIKGNVEAIGREDISLAASASRIARAIGIVTAPVVVSNACISGLAALIQGMRIIREGLADNVVVVGAEVQSRFIITGFQSLKALSMKPCRPFDTDREGLNLGEAAAAMVLSKMPGSYELVTGAIRNDANHISGPSRTGEGSYKALRYVLEGIDKANIAFVNVHGTATVYNDQMEAIALDRAGLAHTPVNALKGVFGHTMGAAGILETIISMAALDAGVVLPTKGFGTLGVSRPVNISASERNAEGDSFIKLLSGFGGINGALLVKKEVSRG